MNALRRYFLFLLGVSLALAGDCAAETARQHPRIDDNWKFFLGDPKDASTTDFDDSDWRSVTLPHDWSIEGKMDPKAPMGGQGGFLPAGIGWYRYHWQAPADWKGKRVRVEFEGVYMNAEVYLNGQKLDSHPYGFTSFFVDLTPALKTGCGNVLAVRVDNSAQKNARWYTGSGIYRHVWLDVTNPVQVAPWGVFVSVPKADAKAAKISVQTTLLNQTANTMSARITTALLGPDGVEIGRGETSVDLAASGSREIKQEIALTHPPLWFPETPRLSTAVTDVIVDDKTVDEVTTRFGVRAPAWSVEKGLTLNGKTYKLAGGCIHDDNGVLGACAFDRAEERKVELLKAAGFNALRTAHNPPSPALLDACDRLGVLVLDEAFDCWVNGKNTSDYHLVFKDWWRRDIDSIVQRDRNHPAIAQDYLGEVGIGRWFYEGDPTEPMTTQKNQPATKLFPVHHGSDELYPWRGANSGSLDLLGNSKPAAHLWNIVWNRGEKLYFAVRQPEDDKKIIVVGWGWYPVWESWTWPGREGKAMSVNVYSRYPSVRLYLNDKLVGEMPTTRKEGYQATFKLTYQPGILKAIGVEDGKESETMQMETVSDPASIKLSADRSTIHADGQDLSFIQVDVLDKQGRLQPNADKLISFTLTGPGTIAGLGNALLKSTEPFQGTTCHVYHGRALIVLRGSNATGTLHLKADSPGLASSSVAINCQ